MKIPRPSGGSRQSAGVGKIYIKYDTPESAKKALQALAGRKFADRTVVTTYFDEVSTYDDALNVASLICTLGKLRGQWVVVKIEVEVHCIVLRCSLLVVKVGHSVAL